MINKLRIAIAKGIESIKQNPDIYLDKLPQGFNAPCFFIRVLSVTDRQKLFKKFIDGKYVVYHFPQPVIRDSEKNYYSSAINLYDWAGKIHEELDEVEAEIKKGDMVGLAIELQDIINVCTSFQEFLGYGFIRRQYLCKAVNDKNAARGYGDDK